MEFFWDFDENYQNGKLETKITLSCDLVFTKNVAIVKNKIEDYYNKNLLHTFNEYYRPHLE